MAKRAAQGSGTIRKKTVTRNGKQYTYWEARITVGRDPGTGKQIQQSFSGKTQKEVREKMQAAAVAVNTGTYTPPSKLTFSEWLDIWTAEYLSSVKHNTADTYKSMIRTRIKPVLGAVKLSDLNPHMMQTFINGLEGLSTGSVHLVYRIIHAALEKAVRLEYLPKNPISHCSLPKHEQKEIVPLDDAQSAALLRAAKGTVLENFVALALFTGMRISELSGLTWDRVDTKAHTITVDRQLLKTQLWKTDGLFGSPKSGKTRVLKVAPSAIAILKDQHRKQAQMRLQAGEAWNNEHDFVFTTPECDPLTPSRVSNVFKILLDESGLQGVRFHDLRHTYAVNAIRAGDDIKSIQGNLGHASVAFTLDKYGHFTEKMKMDSAARMEAFIKSTLNL